MTIIILNHHSWNMSNRLEHGGNMSMGPDARSEFGVSRCLVRSLCTASESDRLVCWSLWVVRFLIQSSLEFSDVEIAIRPTLYEESKARERGQMAYLHLEFWVVELKPQSRRVWLWSCPPVATMQSHPWKKCDVGYSTGVIRSSAL